MSTSKQARKFSAGTAKRMASQFRNGGYHSSKKDYRRKPKNQKQAQILASWG